MLTEAGQKRRRQREAEQRRLEKQLYEHIKCIAPDLHAGIAGAELTPRQLVEILDSMPSVAKVSEAKRMRRRLRAILDDLRKTTGGEVAMPAMEVMIHRPKSPFVGTTMADVAELNRTIEYFIRDISDEPIVDDTLTVARISFAATALGGLLIPALTKALPETLQNGFFAKDGVYWVDFPLPAENGKVLTRRWFLDPVSTCLIAAALRRPVTWPKPYVPRKALQTLLKRLKVADGSPFYRMDDFRRVSEARLRLALPGVLVDFLSSTRRGTSLSARGWWRVLADYHLAPDETDAFPDRHDPIRAAGASLAVPRPGGVVSTSGDDEKTLFAFRRQLYDEHHKCFKPRATALRDLQAFRAGCAPGPMAAALCDWAIWLLAKGLNKRLRPSSVSRYLNAIAARLIRHGGEVDPGGASPDVVEACYEAVLQSTRCEEERAMATTCLRGFHLFLIIEREAEPVTIEGSVIDDGHVRANMISDREYRIVRATLHEQITDKRRRRMLALALLLPYRLGLRRSELRYLRLVDIQRDEHDRRPLLWVHAHPRNRLKTGSSTRRLPLAHLLTDDELHDLVEWLEQRKLECGRDVPVDALLLCPPGQNSAPIEEWQLDLLVAMMREVCGNMSLVFHSLRHSFATNLFGDVMWAGLRDIGAGTRIQQVFPWRTLAPPSTQVKRLFAFDGLPRPGAYLVAALAGHIDPTETMHTYVHLQDYMACLYLRHSAAVTDYPQGFWAALEGITREAMYVRRARDKSRRAKGSHADPPHVDTPRRLLRSLHLRPPPGKQASSQRRASVPDEISKAGLLCLQLDAIYHALSTSMRPMSVEGRALVTGLDPAAFKTLVRHARELASWLTAMRNPAARRSRLLTTHPPRRRPAMSRTPQLDSIGPALPKKHADHGDARTAYQHAVDDPSKVTLVELISLLRSTSRSHAQVRAYSMAGLRQVIKVLDRLGVERPRMHVEVLAWRSKPRKSKGIVASVKRKAPKGLGGITLASNIKRMRPDAAASSDGRFAVKIMSPSGRATMGWRVGCYYAVCVLATQRNIDLQALLARADAARSR